MWYQLAEAGKGPVIILRITTEASCLPRLFWFLST